MTSRIKRQTLKLWDHRSTMTASFTSCFAFYILILLVAGCQKSDENAALTVQMEELTLQNEQLQEQIDQSETENSKLNEQVQVLSGLPEDVRLENLNRVQQVRISRLSGFFDKNKDGKREKMIVYITPVDEQGDGIKATGAASVQLWDLNKANGEAMLGQWDVGPDELKKAWFKTLIAVNYRLKFDIPEAIESFDEQLTVRIAFTDYLTGKIFKAQMVIKPR